MVSDDEAARREFLRQNDSHPDQRNNDDSRQNGNLYCCNAFTNGSTNGFCNKWFCRICIVLAIIIVLFLGISVFASYISRKSDNSKPADKNPSEPSHLTCYHCSWSVNVENKSPLPKENSCLSNPKNTIQCEPGDYCGLRYLEYFDTGSKLLERTCLKRPQILKPGEHICIDQTKDDVNHTICRCNKELCIMQKFDPII